MLIYQRYTTFIGHSHSTLSKDERLHRWTVLLWEPHSPFLTYQRNMNALPSRYPGAKIETRGLPDLSVDVIQNDSTHPAPHVTSQQSKARFRLEKRALSAFHMLLRGHNSDGHRLERLPTCYDKRTFHRGETLRLGLALYACSFVQTRGFHVHEPHPVKSIPPVMARDIGRRLTHTYGWTAEDFEEG